MNRSTKLILSFVIHVGSVIASFVVNSESSTNIASAVKALTTSSVEGVNNLRVSQVNINGRVYEATPSTITPTATSTNNTGLIVGIVVGVLAATVLAVAAVVSYQVYQKKKKGQQLFNEPDIEVSSGNDQNNMYNSPKQDQTPTVPTTQPNASDVNPNRLQSPLPKETSNSRASSAAISISMIDQMSSTKEPNSSKAMPPVELIKFD
jgi:hypothetical protein